jgi:large subunit ribosomal protein L32e
MMVAKKRFLVREIKKRKKLKPRWRRPKGHHSKQRRREKQAAPMPGVGFKSAAKTRGLHPSGKVARVVSNETELKSIDPKKEAIYLGGKLGKRKKLKLQEIADKMKIKVLNRVKEDEIKTAKKAGK